MIEESRHGGEVDGQSDERLNGTGLGDDTPAVDPAPQSERPDPPRSSLRNSPSESSTDFAAAAAMAQDILSMEAAEEDGPARTKAGDMSPVVNTDGALGEDGQRFDSADPPPPPNVPLSPDFFTASRPRKRFRRTR